MKYLLTLSTLAAIIFCLLYVDSCSRLRDSKLAAGAAKSLWNADKLIHEKEISLRDSFVLAQENERIKERERHAKEQSRLSGDLKASKRRERLSRTDTMIVNLTDTIYLKYDTLVADLTNERDSMKISYESSIDSLEFTIVTQKAQIKLADSIISLPVPKQSRLSFGATGGAATVVSPDGKVHAGAGAAIGLTYKIPLNISLRKLFRRK